MFLFIVVVVLALYIDCQLMYSAALVYNETSKFGSCIEGLTSDYLGNIYATNYGSKMNTNTIGKLMPQQRLFFKYDYKAYFNGMQFMSRDYILVADAQNQKVLIMNIVNDVVSRYAVYCENENMIQPNDLTISVNGDVYLSGMKWLPNNSNKDGDIWLCTPGNAKKLDEMSRTNGVEVSPNGKYLYVSESINKMGTPYSQKIWRYRIRENGNIEQKTLFVDFDKVDNSGSIDIDGIRTDNMGNLYVTRNGMGSIMVFDEHGVEKFSISTTFSDPSNIAFGGHDGKTLFVVGKCQKTNEFIDDEHTDKGCLDYTRVFSEGRNWPLPISLPHRLKGKIEGLKWYYNVGNI